MGMVGKAQPLDAKILTPHGFVSMGSLKIGDKVIGADGKAHSVLAIYPQGKKEVFKVTFRDGSETECCDSHLWFTQTRTERDHKLPGAVRDLHTIRTTLRYGTHFNHAVPRVAPVEFESDHDLPVSPWLLGIYLAEGSCGASASISNPESDILERIAESVPESDTTTPARNAIRIRKRQIGSAPSEFKKGLLALGLADKVSDTKFIPECYLFASVDDRLELLRGLCDGDGYVGNPGSIEICTASEQMAKDIIFLIRSLGGSAIMKKRKGRYRKGTVVREVKVSHRIYGTFTNGIVPVASAKQTAKWKFPEWMMRHTIRKVVSVGEKECQCIVIDALDSLYITDDFIVTHKISLSHTTARLEHPRRERSSSRPRTDSAKSTAENSRLHIRFPR